MKEEMNKKTDFEDELNDLPPFLKEMKQNKSGFSMPENYFDAVESSIFKNIEAIGARRKQIATKSSWQEKMNAAINSLWQPRFALGLAVCIAILWSGWTWSKSLYMRMPQELAVITSIEISKEEAEAFVLANIQDFEPAQLAPEKEQDFPSLSQETTNDDPIFEEKELDNILKDLNADDLEELL
jgi:hypothetical protein